ncbi:hypothetical protein ACFPYJ_26555 [Paenibacillus solisilvae]|uniref:Uncharacterized protein n=1 Tax=Paenibacillus solisilvae TaxID=2486751 RepID=A0ABW0W367_9BACL
MKKTKQPGDNISLKTKKTEDPSVMNWINAQTNLMDSLRYLIENEILQNGVRNLQTFIPMERNVLAFNPDLRDRALNIVRSESFIESAAAAAGTREIQKSREEVLAGKSLQHEEPEQPVPSAHQIDTKSPEDTERSALEPSNDEEINDDDIESWI